MSENTSAEVRRHYEALPYPPRDPEDEARRLIQTVGDNLAELNHYGFRGRQTFMDGFRALVAGGGTGDSAIFLAEQLRQTDAEIVYLDLSTASRAVAETRARARGLDNIRFVTGSLLELGEMDLGGFDYINCSGVLHHLVSPEDGLRSLVDVLKPEGVIYLMLYGEYGRRGIYEMQSIFRTLLPETLSIPERVACARRILEQLPASNYFQRNRELWEHEIGAAGYGDAGLYDLLLHSQDRAYDVEAIYRLPEAAGLELVDFIGPQKRCYDLHHWLTAPELAERIAGLNVREARATAEKIAGNITKHSFYVARPGIRKASLDDEALCIILTGEMAGMNEELFRAITPGEILEITHTRGNSQEVFRLQGTPVIKTLCKYFDGQTPIARLIEKTRMTSGIGNTQRIRAELAQVFNLLNTMGWAYLMLPPR